MFLFAVSSWNAAICFGESDKPVFLLTVSSWIIANMLWWICQPVECLWDPLHCMWELSRACWGFLPFHGYLAFKHVTLNYGTNIVHFHSRSKTSSPVRKVRRKCVTVDEQPVTRDLVTHHTAVFPWLEKHTPRMTCGDTGMTESSFKALLKFTLAFHLNQVQFPHRFQGSICLGEPCWVLQSLEISSFFLFYSQCQERETKECMNPYTNTQSVVYCPAEEIPYTQSVVYCPTEETPYTQCAYTLMKRLFKAAISSWNKKQSLFPSTVLLKSWLNGAGEMWPLSNS